MSTTQTSTQTAMASDPTAMISTAETTPVPPTDLLERVSYLFGYPIAHSLSPLLHGTIYKALSLNYAQHLYESRSLPDCLALTRTPKFFGASVTMPHKVAIITHLDMLTPEAEAIGAVNTIFLRDSPSGERLLCGTNTDCIGIREAVLQNVDAATSANFKGKPGVVIGGGGTCRAAVYALKYFLGCNELYLINRDPAEVAAVIAECESKGFGDGLKYISTMEEAQALAAAPVIISAIPDFAPKTQEEIVTRQIIECVMAKEKGAILEMCYHPSPETAIAKIAVANGWQLIGGSEAMIWQGLEQDKVWLRQGVSTLPVEEVKQVIAAKLLSQRLH